MSDMDATTVLPPELTDQLEDCAELPGVEVRRLKDVPATPLSEAEILDAARDLLPSLDPARFTTLAELNSRRPWVNGVAWLDFQGVTYYKSGDAPFVLMGNLVDEGMSPPILELTLANPPTRDGVLVICRAKAFAVGPNLPGFYRITGPGVNDSFADTGDLTLLSFVVSPGTTGPLEIKISTDLDGIRAWGFFDCRLTQI